MDLQLVQQELDVTKQNFLQSEWASHYSCIHTITTVIRNMAKERDQTVTEKDSAISHLRYQFESLTDQIKV